MEVANTIQVITWLVVYLPHPTPLKNMSSSVGMMKFPIYTYGKRIHSCSKPPTSYSWPLIASWTGKTSQPSPESKPNVNVCAGSKPRNGIPFSTVWCHSSLQCKTYVILLLYIYIHHLYTYIQISYYVYACTWYAWYQITCINMALSPEHIPHLEHLVSWGLEVSSCRMNREFERDKIVVLLDYQEKQ